MSSTARIYAAPWADRLPDGKRLNYGPSPTKHARLLSEHKLWTWRPEVTNQVDAALPDRSEMRAFMRPDRKHLRVGVPTRELQVYLLVYEHGFSVRGAATELAITRSSVRVYVRRLRARRAAHTDALTTTSAIAQGSE